MELKVKSAAWKNLLATGDTWIKIDVTSSKSALITGKNGEGKSQLLDAVFYAWFGRPFRKLKKKAGLINSRNNKGLEVKVEFSAGPNEYLVHRGMKPNIFNIYCNGKLIDQHAASRDYQQLLEDTVLHMNHKSAAQVVVLGSAKFIPFMSLSASDRRAVIEDILDIKVFTLMNVALKDKVAKLKIDYTNNESEIQRSMQNVALLQQILDTEKKGRDGDIKVREDSILNSDMAIEDYRKKIKHAEMRIAEIQATIDDHQDVKKKIDTLNTYEYAFKDKIQKIKDDLWFFEENDICPTCSQDIGEDHKKHVMLTKHTKKLEFERGLEQLTEETKKIDDRLNTIHECLRDMVTHSNEVSKLYGDIRGVEAYKVKLQKEIADIKAKSNTNSETATKLIDAKAKLVEQEKLKTDYMYQAKVFEKTSGMLKDGGIKSEIIKNYLPKINQAIAKFLQDLGFKHSFELDENFDETIKSHYIDEFSYENFSEGEKQRIDLALLLTWRYIAKLKGSINTNLLIMDETFDSSMDEEGVDDLIRLFQTNFAKDNNLIVISHREGMVEKFDRHIKFKKVKGYSQMSVEK